MNGKKLMLFAVMSFWGGSLTAAFSGGAPYEIIDREATGYHLVGNSLLDDRLILWGEAVDARQGDTCVDRSTVTLSYSEFFTEAVVVKAYLIWMGAVDPAKLDEPTDDTVHLSFTRPDGYTREADIVAGDMPRYLGDAGDPFLFDSIRFAAEVPVGCSESEPGVMTTAELAYFTYRVEVTDLFTAIAADNRAAVIPLENGEAFYGDYTVSGLECTQDDVYRCSTLMVSNWALFIAYEDRQRPQKIALYPGFALEKEIALSATFSGLDIPADPWIQMSLLAAEGDPRPDDGGAEGLFLWDEAWQEKRSINDDCDPNDPVGREIWDSRFTVSWYSEKNGIEGYCDNRVGATYTYGLDIDRWDLDGSVDPEIGQFLPVGTTDMNLSFHFSSDEVLTNLFVITTYAPLSMFDNPGKEEMRNCPCAAEEGREVFCAGEPQYFLITVENWGNGVAEEVYLLAKYNAEVFDYVPDTTEIATEFDQKGDGLNWQRLLDGPDGLFPLADPNLIANKMSSFKADPQGSDSYLIRFQLRPKKELPKNAVGEVSASVSDQDGFNPIGYPVRSYPGLCATTCTEKELQERCGGVSSGDAAVYDPSGDAGVVPDEEEPTDADQITDPRFFHPMGTQTPGCSLTLL